MNKKGCFQCLKKRHFCCFMSVNRGLFAGILARWWEMCMCREEAWMCVCMRVTVWVRNLCLSTQITHLSSLSAMTLTFVLAMNIKHDEEIKYWHTVSHTHCLVGHSWLFTHSYTYSTYMHTLSWCTFGGPGFCSHMRSESTQYDSRTIHNVGTHFIRLSRMRDQHYNLRNIFAPTLWVTEVNMHT